MSQDRIEELAEKLCNCPLARHGHIPTCRTIELRNAVTDLTRAATPRWIPVTPKTLPKFDTPVLCYCEIYGRFVGVYSQIDGTNWGQWSNQKEIGILPPKAWQPLPPAPSSQKGEA
jgi:hypothetical protein